MKRNPVLLSSSLSKLFGYYLSPCDVSLLDSIILEQVDGIIKLNILDTRIDAKLADSFIKGTEKMLETIKNVKSKGYLNELVDLPIIKDFLAHFGLSGKIDVQRNELAYNFIILNLYIVGTLIHDKTIKGVLILEEDTMADLKALLSNLEIRLPNAVKIHLRRQGIKIIQNIYNGFDTEYELSSSYRKLNELLSVQLACNVGMYIKLPFSQNGFELMYVNPQTTELHSKKDVTDDDLKTLEDSIKNGISMYRELFLKEHDCLIETLIKGFKSMSLPSTTTNDSIIFAFKLSDVKKMIKITSSYSSEDLIKDANSLVKGIIEDNAFKIIETINKFTGRTKELESIKTKMFKAFTKRTSRIGYGYGEGNKISITTVRNLYISCHMTSADLSMLSDFETFKERLDIVNKCFTTRGLPLIEIKSNGESVSV